MGPPLRVINATVWVGPPDFWADQMLYMTDVVHAQPSAGAVTLDLSGYFIMPGLINAHDHLELNHYPRSKFQKVYGNAHQWGEAMDARLDDSPYRELRAYPSADRLFSGGLKNLLSGATTVAQHNPPHKALFRPDFPVRVLERYGWAHSLHFDSPESIRASYLSTPPDVPWFIHLAEGTDSVAASEYQQLKDLGCVGPNTVIVHGVGMTDADIADAAQRVRGLVWCPSTNGYLLGETTPIREWYLRNGVSVALGSDSRLTADGDILDEMHAAWSSTSAVDIHFMLEALTNRPAAILGLSDVGHLRPGARAAGIALTKNRGRWRRRDLAV
ncbi:MAG: amidohydrolase family protein, partial [Chloroflexi bacterium]|nr:amidohydrolase family protein [Chloroflexota bacterium]